MFRGELNVFCKENKRITIIYSQRVPQVQEVLQSAYPAKVQIKLKT